MVYHRTRSRKDASPRSSRSGPARRRRPSRPTCGVPSSDVLKTVRVAKVTTMDDQVNASIIPERLIAMLSGFFGGLGALLAAIGLYGLLAYTVTRRTSEIGVRMALGATEGNVTRMVLTSALGLVVRGPHHRRAARNLERTLRRIRHGESVGRDCPPRQQPYRRRRSDDRVRRHYDCRGGAAGGVSPGSPRGAHQPDRRAPAVRELGFLARRVRMRKTDGDARCVPSVRGSARSIERFELDARVRRAV